MKKISILGSTGSVGTSALGFIKKFPNEFQVVGLAAGDRIDILAEQVRTFRPKVVATRTEAGLKQLLELTKDIEGVEYGFGVEAAESVASLSEVEIVLSAIVGSAGLRPTMAAAKAGKTIALANKESLVVAGALVTETVKRHGAKLLPVDSEHSAIYQCLVGSDMKHVHQLILTASGGPFFLKPEIDTSTVTRAQALKHPNWSMGEKITIDSATMMNKGFEAIEACWLFDIQPKQVGVVVHPQSIIHSMVDFVDGSIVAQLGVPDMAGPIAYALSYPDRLPDVMPRVNFAKLREFTFYEPDHRRFPSINHALQSFDMGPTFPAVLNGANEVTVRAFLDEKIAFTDIAGINEHVLGAYTSAAKTTLEDFIDADRWGRQEAEKMVTKKEKRT